MPVPADASVSKFIYAMYALKSGQDAQTLFRFDADVECIAVDGA